MVLNIIRMVFHDYYFIVFDNQTPRRALVSIIRLIRVQFMVVTGAIHIFVSRNENI